MKTIKRIISVLLSIGMLYVFSISALAAVYGRAVFILPNFAWTADSDNTDSRSGNYNNVWVRLTALSPTEGHIGYYTKIKVRVTNGFDAIISDTYTINKNDNYDTYIPLINTSNSTGMVGFEFQGNTANDAYATVNFSGR